MGLPDKLSLSSPAECNGSEPPKDEHEGKGNQADHADQFDL